MNRVPFGFLLLYPLMLASAEPQKALEQATHQEHGAIAPTPAQVRSQLIDKGVAPETADAIISVSKLYQALETSKGYGDAAAVFVEFLKKDKFVKTQFEPSPDEALRRQDESWLKGEVESWTKNQAGQAALLYHAIGANYPLPKWATADMFSPRAKDIEPQLIENLKAWTKNVLAQNQSALGPAATQSASAKWVAGFFGDAYREAQKLLAGRLPQDARDRINLETPITSVAPGNPQAGPDAAPAAPAQTLQGGEIGVKELYNAGVKNAPDHLKLGDKTFSVRLVTLAEGEEGEETYTDKLAIVDVSKAPASVAGIAVDIDPHADPAKRKPIVIDGEQYWIIFEPAGGAIQIKLVKVGSKEYAHNDVREEKDGDKVVKRYLTLTVEDTCKQRMDFARKFSNNLPMDINGRPYFVMPQMMGEGCYQFLPADQSTGCVSAEGMCCIAKQVKGPRGYNMKHEKQGAGWFGDKYYFCEPHGRTWKLVEGKPRKKKKEGEGDDGKDPGKKPTGGRSADYGEKYHVSDEVNKLNEQLDESIDIKFLVDKGEVATAQKFVMGLGSDGQSGQPATVPFPWHQGASPTFAKYGLAMIDATESAKGHLLLTENEAGVIVTDLKRLRIGDSKDPKEGGASESRFKHVGVLDYKKHEFLATDEHALKAFLTRGGFTSAEAGKALDNAKATYFKGTIEPAWWNANGGKPQLKDAIAVADHEKIVLLGSTEAGKRSLRIVNLQENKGTIEVIAVIYPELIHARGKSDEKVDPKDQQLQGKEQQKFDATSGVVLCKDWDDPLVAPDTRTKYDRKLAEKDGAIYYSDEKKEWAFRVAVKIEGDSNRLCSGLLPIPGDKLAAGWQKQVNFAALEIKKYEGAYSTLQLEAGQVQTNDSLRPAYAMYLRGREGKGTGCSGIVFWFGDAAAKQKAEASCREVKPTAQ